MKKFIYIFALVGLVAASCSKVPVTEIDNQAPATGTYTYVLNASMPDEITKTTYAGDKTFAWSTGDQISVLFHKGDDNKFFTLTTAKGGSASAKFEGEITDGYTIGSSDDGKKWALYPANANHTYTAGETNPISFYIPGETDFTAAGAHFSANIPMEARGDDNGNYTFKHLSTCYKFTFTGLSSVSKVKLTVENIKDGRYLSGNSPLMLSGSEYYLNYYESPLGGSKVVSIIDNVKSNTATFYVSCRGWDKFQPQIILQNMDEGENNEKIIYRASAGATLTTSSVAWGKMVVVPSKDVSSYGVGVPFWSTFGINWSSATAITSGTSSVPECKYASDADYIYFYYKVKKSSVGFKGSSGGYRYQSYMFTAYDTDGDPTNVSAEVGAGIGTAGWEASSELYPFKGTTEGNIEFVNGDDSNGKINCPVGTNSGQKIRTYGSVFGDYAYVECRIPRATIGCSTAGLTIRVKLTFGWSAIAEQNITLL